MDIMLTEAASGDADAVAARLTVDGHRVHRCNLAGTDRCAPLARGQGCPLHDGTASIVVDVRAAPVAFGAHELGAMCAVQAGVPLVVCGPTPDEAGPWRNADVRCTEEALPEVLAFADPVCGEATRHRVERAVAMALHTLGREDPVEVDIRSDLGLVRVTVMIERPPHVFANLVAEAVRGALAGVTLHWASTLVTLSTPERAGIQAGQPAEGGEPVGGPGPVAVDRLATGTPDD